MLKLIKNKSSNLKIYILNLIFPLHCSICDDILNYSNDLICESCKEKVKYMKEPVCVKCGKQVEEEQEYCHDCQNRKHYFIRGVALFEYNSISACVYRFKYGDRQEYAEFFGTKLSERFGRKIMQWKAQALIPVPIHPSRKRKRGYNQAELLARVLSRETGVPIRTDIIVRCKKTKAQKNLDIGERENNLKKAFKICKNDVKLDTIVIIDDIYTTGSTINAVAYELQQAGIHNIYYVALAIGMGI